MRGMRVAALRLAPVQLAAAGIGAVLAAGLLGGCVERTVKIETQPPGALVTVNDEEVGVSPVRFSFTWYGDYDLILRKPGYQTLKTHYHIEAPWYEYPPIDLIAETMIPKMIRDEHTLPVYTLEKAEPPKIADLVEQAVEMRDRALFEGE